MHLPTMEHELQQCWQFPYQWGRRQNDAEDQQTRYIYRCQTFRQLVDETARRFPEHSSLRAYAYARWYNFTSARAIEHVFTRHSRVRPAPPRHHTIDFYIDGIPFDLKISVFPRGFPGTLTDAVSDPHALITWLYRNQSTEGRYHTANRLFLVLHSSTGPHWKLRAHLTGIAGVVQEYLAYFSADALHPIGSSSADILWYFE